MLTFVESGTINDAFNIEFFPSETTGLDDNNCGAANITRSGNTIDIICIIDVVESDNYLSHRKRALEEVEQASATLDANLIICSVILLFRMIVVFDAYSWRCFN